jgi:hypothetical protein
MGDFEAEKPEFSGWALFLVSIAQSFSKCREARAAMNIQALINNLDCLSLEFKGWYETTKGRKDCAEVKESDINQRIEILRLDINKIIERYNENDSYEIPFTVWTELRRIEADLRLVWNKSGLQMSMRPEDDDTRDY